MIDILLLLVCVVAVVWVAVQVIGLIAVIVFGRRTKKQMDNFYGPWRD